MIYESMGMYVCVYSSIHGIITMTGACSIVLFCI